MNKLEEILENFPEDQFLKADGFDEAVIGLCYVSQRLIYSINKCIDILVEEHEMEYEEALDYFYYNTAGAYVGEQTPIYCLDNF